jgi:hypothetical protein
MSALMICFSCAAFARKPGLCTAERYNLSVRCVCGAIEPWKLTELRADLNALEATAERKPTSSNP